MAVELNIPLDGAILSDAAKIQFAEGKQKVELESIGSGSDLNPAMTSDTTPSPYVVSASTYLDNDRRPWHAFHDAYGFESPSWLTALYTVTGWIKIDRGLGNGVIVTCLRIAPYWGAGYENIAPKNWTFAGSNNNVDWTTLDTQTNVTDWTIGVYKTYIFNNSTAYRYYRINVTANNGNTNYLGIGQIEMINSYPTDGPTATLLQVDLGANYTINETDLLIPCNTLAEAGTVQARRKLDNGSWGAFQDLVAISYYERAFAGSGTFQCRYLDLDIKLNSNGTQQARAGRPRIKNFTPAGGGGGGVWGSIR